MQSYSDLKKGPPKNRTRETPAGPARPVNGRISLSDLKPRLHPILFYTFAAFVGTIPFETIDLGLTDFTIAKMVGYLFFLLALRWYRVCFRRIPVALGCFVAYLLVFLFSYGLIAPQYRSMALERFFTLVQCLILFWVSYNLLKYREAVNASLGALALSCFVLAALQLLGVTRTVYHGGIDGRMSAFQENPNNMGAVLSLGVISLIGLVYRREHTPSLVKYCVWGMVPVIAIAIVDTGSRGSIVALAAGVLAFVLARGTTWVRVRNIMICLFVLGVLIAVTLRSENSVERWKEALGQGDMAGREGIFPEACKMVLEKPLMGWGPIQNFYELGRRLGRPTRDTHNVFLLVLTEVGLLGSVPYFFGLWLFLRSAWRARVGLQGILPLALLLTLMVTSMKASNDERKLFWLILAYSSASGIQAFSKIVRGSASNSFSETDSPCPKPWHKNPDMIPAGF